MIYKLDYTRTITPLTTDFVEGLYTLYAPNNSLIVLDGADINNFIIPNNISSIIFDDATNPIDVVKHTAQINLKQYTILTGLYSYHNLTSSYIHFFPFWAIWMSNPVTGIIDRRQHKFSTHTKKYKVSCLNGTPWLHRKFLYLKLKNKSYYNDLIFSFGNRPSYTPLDHELILTDDELKEFNQLPASVAFTDSDSVSGIDLTISHPAYQQSYVNLVTETTVNPATPMLSEKTFKPIVAGQLFVLIAPPQAIQFLRNIGIDTFDDIIDHSYDNILDTRQRIETAITQIDQLMTMDLEKIYSQLRPRLERNSKFFTSEEFRSQFPLTF